MKCPKCHYENVPNAAFCNMCYQVLNEKVASDPPAPVSSNPPASPLMPAPSPSFFRLRPFTIILLVILMGTALFHKQIHDSLVSKNVIQQGMSEGDLLFQLLSVPGQHDQQAIKSILDSGVNPNIRKGDSTPLRIAITSLDIVSLKLLIIAGADTNDRDSQGKTPLFLIGEAAPTNSMMDKLRLEMSRTLFQNKTDVNVKDFKSHTVLDYAKANGNDPLIKLLVEAGAKEGLALAPEEFSNPVESNSKNSISEAGVHDQEELSKACDSGDAESCFAFGQQIFKAAKDSKSIAQAFGLFKKSAKSGVVPAYHELGMVYGTGQGVEKDIVLSLDCYCKAARQGYVRSMGTLAKIYLDGAGVKSDKAIANLFFILATLQAADSEKSTGLYQQLQSDFKVMSRKEREMALSDADLFKNGQFHAPPEFADYFKEPIF